MNSKMPLENIKLSLHSPHFFPPGIRFHLSLKNEKTNINIYPVLSLFSQYIEIEDTKIDTKIFSVMTNNNVSPIGGIIAIDGFFKIASGLVTDGEIKIKSDNLSIITVYTVQYSRIQDKNEKLDPDS